MSEMTRRLPDYNWTDRGDGTEARHHVSREPKNETEEHHDVLDANELHVFKDAEFGGDWVVWLNTEASDFDGLCVGVGLTRQAAVTQAVRVLEAALERLQGPPPARG